MRKVELSQIGVGDSVLVLNYSYKCGERVPRHVYIGEAYQGRKFLWLSGFSLEVADTETDLEVLGRHYLRHWPQCETPLGARDMEFYLFDSPGSYDQIRNDIYDGEKKIVIN